MARPYTPRVNDVVTYYTATCKPRPAKVTVAGATPTLKILSSNEVFAAVPRTTARTPSSWKSV